MKTQIEPVVEWIKNIIDEEGYQLVDLLVKGTANAPVFQVFVDHEKGVTIKDCSYLHRIMLDVIDMHSNEIGINDYRLEVSSPGVNRPLEDSSDFNKNKGRHVAITYDSNGSEIEIQGIVLETSVDSVNIQVDEQVYHVPFDTIRNAKIKLQW